MAGCGGRAGGDEDEWREGCLCGWEGKDVVWMMRAGAGLGNDEDVWQEGGMLVWEGKDVVWLGSAGAGGGLSGWVSSF